MIISKAYDERLNEFYQHAPCGFLITHPNGTILKANNQFLKWTGYTEEQLVDQIKLQSLFTIGGKIFYETHHAPLLSMRGFVNELAYEIECANHNTTPVLLNAVQVKDGDGKVEYNIITILNITERKKYEAEMISSKKLAEKALNDKALFISSLSHEIRTPLHILNSVTILLQDTNLTSEQAVYIQLLKNASENVLQIVNDVLDFSKIEAGQAVLHEDVFSLREMLGSVKNLFAFRAQEKRIELDLLIDENIHDTLIGDAIKIKQVISNLVSNAIKFTDKGHVKIIVEHQPAPDDYCSFQLSVEDTGIGIDENQMSVIFQDFKQATPEIHSRFGGTGLGLSISQRILGFYGKKIHVKSTGNGSLFSFKLTLKKGRINETQIIPTIDHTKKTLNILLAEDNKAAALVVSHTLKKLNAVVDVVHTGNDAFSKIMTNNYDLVLMDVQMPEENGTEATTKVRTINNNYFKILPIIAFTADHDFKESNQWKDSGFSDCLIKPFQPEELFQIIEKHTMHLFSKNQKTEMPDYTSDTELINLDHLIVLMDDTPQKLSELILKAIDSLTLAKIDIHQASLDYNTPKLHSSIHSISSLFHYLKAKPVLDIIKQNSTTITNIKQSEESDQAYQTILKCIDDILNELILKSKAL